MSTHPNGGGDRVATSDNTSVASQASDGASSRLSREAVSLFDSSSMRGPEARRGSERGTENPGGTERNNLGSSRATDNQSSEQANASGRGDSANGTTGDGMLDIPPIWDTRALATSGRNTAPGQGENSPRRSGENAPPKPGEKTPPKPGEPDPSRNMEDGPVVQLTTRFGGTNRSSHGSGFLVGPNGETNEPIDGKRFIATAHHVVDENHVNDKSQTVYETTGNNFAATDANGDKVLSREEVAKRAQELQNVQKPDSKTREQAFQFKHLNDNFDEISKISKGLDPSAPDGISEAGLKEYYRRNLDITVDTKRGSFKADLVDATPNSDTALLQMKLDPRVERALGNNIPIARDLPRKGDQIKSEGYPGVALDKGDMFKYHRRAYGNFMISGREETNGRHVSEIQTTLPGMSGGPTMNKRGEAIGVNSADATLDGKNYLFTGPASDIREMLRRQRGGR